MARTRTTQPMKRRPVGTGLKQALKVSSALVGKMQKRAEKRQSKKGGGK